MKKNYRATAIFSRIISVTSWEGDLWADSAVTRSHVEDTSSKMTMLPLCFIKNPDFPSPETFGGFWVTCSSSAHASSSVILAIVFSSFIKQTAIDIPALHSVEYIDTVIIDHVVHNFKQVAAVVEPHNQMFVRLVVPNVIINGIDDSLSNSCKKRFLTGNK